ncbi:MAG: dolichyl-phosphate beta-glucosyltransferase [Deltaproteobacteria bacterium]
MTPYLSIVIPVYNGGAEISANAARVLAYLDKKNFSSEVILVNDGSSDDTGKALASIQDARVRVITNEKNIGKGYSVKRGMLSAKGEFVVFCDADLAYPIEQVDGLLDRLEAGSDIAIGSRVHKESIFILHCRDLRYIFIRHLLSRTFNLLIRLILVKGITDTQIGFKGFTRNAAQTLFSRQTARDFSFDIEILYLARKAGLQIKEIPVTLVYSSGASAVSMLRDPFSMPLRALKVLYRYYSGGYGLSKR